MTEEKTPKVYAAAAKAIERANGDLEAAVKIMRDRVEQNAGLFRELMTPLMDAAIRDAVRNYMHKQRSAVWNQRAPRFSNAERLGALASVTKRSLMDFVLPTTNRPLREAGRNDVLASSEFYGKQASDMAWKSRWLRAIAARLENAPVGETLTDDDLTALQKQAEITPETNAA